MCAPFWWSVAKPEDTAARILHNGTICYVDTGSRRIGITASHVYKEYLADKENHGAEAIECQFGNSTIYPEKHVIADSERWDIATFDLPDVFVGGAIRNPNSYHHAVLWPPQRAQKSDAVIFGGFPGVLREEKGSTADLPFQWVAGRVSEVTDDAITLEPDFEKMRWQGPETNDNPGGWSGGPVFRSVEDEPIARLGVRPSISLARFWCWVEFPAGDLLVRQRQGSGGRSRAGWTNTAWQQFLAPRRSLRELFEPHFLLAIHGRGCASSICCASGKSTPIRRAPSPTRARETLASRAPV